MRQSFESWKKTRYETNEKLRQRQVLLIGLLVLAGAVAGGILVSRYNIGQVPEFPHEPPRILEQVPAPTIPPNISVATPFYTVK